MQHCELAQVYPPAIALVCQRRVGKTIGDDPYALRESGRDQPGDVVVAGGDEQQGLADRVPALTLAFEQQSPDRLAARRASRLARLPYRDSSPLQRRHQPPDLRRLAGALAALNRDEPAPDLCYPRSCNTTRLPPLLVIPAKAGIHRAAARALRKPWNRIANAWRLRSDGSLGPGLRRADKRNARLPEAPSRYIHDLSVPVAPHQIAGQGRDAAERVHAGNVGGGYQRHFSWRHIGSGDDHLADGLALGDRRGDRAIILGRDLHVFARLSRQGYPEILADRQRHLRLGAEPDLGLIHFDARRKQPIIVELAERPIDQSFALLRARLHRRQPAEHKDDAAVLALDRSGEAVARLFGMPGLQPVRTHSLIEQGIAIALLDIVEFVLGVTIVVIIIRKIPDRPHRQCRQ